MSKFTVEFTSQNPNGPQQITVEAATAGAAISKVLPHGLDGFLEPYGDDPSYKGWSYVKLSVSGALTCPVCEAEDCPGAEEQDWEACTKDDEDDE